MPIQQAGVANHVFGTEAVEPLKAGAEVEKPGRSVRFQSELVHIALWKIVAHKAKAFLALRKALQKLLVPCQVEADENRQQEGRDENEAPPFVHGPAQRGVRIKIEHCENLVGNENPQGRKNEIRKCDIEYAFRK